MTNPFQPDAPPTRSLPLQRWTVENFKSIPSAEIEFAPLTLLVGTNSSGKSSILQSLLLVVQAAQGSSEGSTFPLNGPLASVGGFNDVLFRLAKRKEVSIGGVFRLEPVPFAPTPKEGSAPTFFTPDSGPFTPTSDIRWRFSFDAPPPNEPGSADIASTLLAARAGATGTDADLGVSFDLHANRRGQGELAVDEERLRVARLAWPTRTDFALGYSGTLQGRQTTDTDITGLFLRAGMPFNVLRTWRLGDLVARSWVEARIERPYWSGAYGPGPRDVPPSMPRGRSEPPEEMSRWIEVAVDEISSWDLERRAGPVTLPASLGRSRSGIPLAERRLLRSYSSELIDSISAEVHLDEVVYAPPEVGVAERLNDVMGELHRFFRERVVYLGPLRQDPQIVYRAAPVGAEGFLGIKGEHMAAVVHASRTRDVLCPMDEGPGRTMRLVEALDYWVRRLEIADAVHTQDLGRLGIQVSVDRGEIRELDLTSVGVGVSQLLPVVVMCLLAPPGSVVLIEQPELHLHPALQQRLGDFLLACARSGRQLLVETHSEHVISRIRYRIANDPTDDVRSWVAIWYGEQQDSRSTFRRVEISPFGGIQDWPRGFFDQTAEESKRIVEAGLDKQLRPAPERKSAPQA
jgi:predicted ATPase